MVPELSNDLVLGMDWLQQWNPVIDWVAFTLLVKFGGDDWLLHALPRRKVASVELCSVDALLKTAK